MKKQILILALLIMTPLASYGARVAVTDSGTDFSHKWLVGKALINENEIPGNMVDDDRNGKVDDIVGWNFVDDYGKVFFPEHLKYINEDIFKYFEVISRIQAGTQTKEDEVFWKANVTSLEPEKKTALLAKLNFYGQYAHSTHVSGIIASIATNSKIMSNRVLADTPPDEDVMKTKGDSSQKLGPADIVYKILAAATNGTFQKVGVYLNERKIDVANYSLGVSFQTIAKLVLALKGIKNPTPEQISSEIRRISAQFVPMGKAWMAESPGTLFVVAAGNDGTDNDTIPAFPANVIAENSISVAASQGFTSLAKFSNFGKTTVDIAAPGVAIVSSVPSLDHEKLLPLSGTSMAAPYITGVAARAKEINPNLSPADLKLILMSTVDQKDWLKGKVVCGGVVNLERVVAAAEKSKSMTLAEAIQYAKDKVKDQYSAPVHVNRHIGKSSTEMENMARSLVF